MTVSQWIMIIELGLKLWEALNDEKATDETKQASILSAIAEILPMLKDKEADKVREVIGNDGENLPVLFGIIGRIDNLLK